MNAIDELAGHTSSGFAHWVYVLAAFCALLLAVWLGDGARRREPGGKVRIAALIAMALWALLCAALGAGSLPAQLAETLRDLGWLGLVYALFASDGRDGHRGPVRPLMIVLAFVEALQAIAIMLELWFGAIEGVEEMIFHISVMLRLLVTTGVLVLVHNLYVGAVAQQRIAVRWACAAMALVWGYDLNFYTIAYLANWVPDNLVAIRALTQIIATVLLAFGAARAQSSLRFSPSRTIAFQSLSLLVIGGYMIVMVGAAQSLAWLGGNASQLAQLGFAVAITVLVLAVMPSKRLRGWAKVVLAKHLFQHRYDYRAEWLRFTRTIGHGGAQALPLHARVVQALADITDSAQGLLLVPSETGDLELAGRWQWPAAEVPGMAMEAASVAFFEQHGFIVDLDEVRAGTDHQGERARVPGWLVEDREAWALVPLLHFERLVGMVVLGRPPVTRQLDWEDFDLLRVVGQQLASYLAENNGQVALLEANRFDEFNRRIAFVMHDIKNLASQLSLLSRNAERHAENPAFRADMLVTLRNSTDKLNALLARLSRYGKAAPEKLAGIDVADVCKGVVTRYAGAQGPRAHAVGETSFGVLAHRETLEQVLLHLVQNAIDASPQGMPVLLRWRIEGAEGCIDVVDTGAGMSADFVRNGLFKPFVSTKSGGFGIGAFEAREMVRAMRGRLDVESREGLGSRFTIRLPLAPAAEQHVSPGTGEGSDEKKVA